MNVGTKELKNNLSRYLRLVRGGERVLVTDRGMAIAELRSVTRGVLSDEDALLELERQGLVTRGRGRLRKVVPERCAGSGPKISDIVVEGRG
jgi:antitoxin (DNA-binding transcriptional repressor) of toxin-antitoxin stability system